MKASELRIGNIVIGHDGRFHKVTASCIVAQSQYDAAKALGYRSIPLTEAILFKCGFVNEFSNSFSDHVIQIFKNNGNVAGAEIGDYYCSTGQRYVCSFKFLHQLQNLYFVLTNGQELEFKR